MNQLKPHQSPKFTKTRLCCPFGGISRWSFILSFCRTTTINSEGQLDKLSDALKENWLELVIGKGVVFHQSVRQKLLQLEWDVLPHLPYSPDSAPSDYYLCRSLQNFLDGRTFTSKQDVKNHLNLFFVTKDQKFYEASISCPKDGKMETT